MRDVIRSSTHPPDSATVPRAQASWADAIDELVSVASLRFGGGAESYAAVIEAFSPEAPDVQSAFAEVSPC